MTALTLQLSLWAALLLPVALSRQVRHVWRATSLPGRATVLLIAGATLLVQLTYASSSERRSTAYPFTPWTMYTGPTSVVSYWSLNLEFPDGSSRSYPLEWLDRRHVRTAMSRLRLEAERARDADDAVPADAPGIDASLAHLLNLHNRIRHDDAASAIVLTHHRQRLREYSGPERMPSNVVTRVTREQADASR